MRVARDNARALAEAGHDVTFWCTNMLEKGQSLVEGTTETNDDGVRVVRLNTWSLRGWSGGIGPTFSPGIFGRIAREIDHFDVVHLHEFRSFLAWTVGLAAIRRGIPFVLQPQGTLLSGGASSRLKRVYDRFIGQRLLNRAACLVAATLVEAAMAHAAGVDPDRIRVIPNGLDARRYATVPARGGCRQLFGIAAGEVLVLAIGRLDIVKGQDLLVEAFACVPRGQARLVIVGPDHGLLPTIEQIIARHNLRDEVLITGALSDEDLLKALVDCDVFVVPSRFEAFGMAILEACYFSKPLVLTSSCQNAASFDGHGALVAAPEPEALGAAISRYLADPALREANGRLGRQVLDERFILSEVRKQLERLYAEIVGAGGRQAAAAGA